MKFTLLPFCLFVFAMLPATSILEEAPPLTINLFCELNNHGLSADAAVLDEALTAQGCRVRRVDRKDREVLCADINIFCEKMYAEHFKKAKKNWLIPNPEWFFNQSLKDLNRIDLILCRTKEVERIFNELGMRTYFLGFTSLDCFRSDAIKKADQYLHLAGNSPLKGTAAIVKTWKANKNFPLLVVISKRTPPASITSNIKWKGRYVEREELLDDLNESLVHLCLSETEGFGHYISEAMSCGSIVVTTDAPPMNEFIEDSRFLVPYQSVKAEGLATLYRVSSRSIEEKIREIAELSSDELKAAGEANRQRYLEMKKNLKRISGC
ncbi:putative uncharacterized protein [Waddlia chondrophila 2032/99]|uniref:Glycosyl transferase family 1 domain-containing protein n=1 Tax=Waddlia chondrophila 2032/99 TaxID=765953 RepID=F8LBX0_9BACT|nr:putative uncharacterized protein [Waddlia chondrophila 2032/99]